MMPASTMDPLTSALKSALHGPSSHKKLETGLVSTIKKTQLASKSNPVPFDPPMKQWSGGLNTALKKGNLIFLNSNVKKQHGNHNESKDSAANRSRNSSNGETSKQVPAALPKPKITFFPVSAVEVGYTNNRRPGAGMFNMGNTCYLNSTLQALFHVPAFYNYLMSGSHQRQCRNSNMNGHISPCIVCAVTLTLRETLTNHVIRPSKIYDRLKAICKHLIHGRQEDAHEFLRYLIEALQRSFLISCQASKNLDNASKETTPFNQIFGGYMQQDVVCMKCNYNSITFQHFMDLLLDIRNASTIEEALALYFRGEKIGSDDGNMYKCEKCKIKVPARKRSFIARPPVVLCIQLKRFSLMGGKISKPVQLNRRIVLDNYMKRSGPGSTSSSKNGPLQYRLVSMITHVGPSPNCGHYTAIGEASWNQFFQFDDSSVRSVPANQAMNTASYVVFYEMMKPSKQAWIGQGTATVEQRPVVNGFHSNNSRNMSETPVSMPKQIRPKLITETAMPNKLGTTMPNKLGTTMPNKLGTTTPNKLGTTTPNKLGTTIPNKLGMATPNKLGMATPNKLGTALPNKLGIVPKASPSFQRKPGSSLVPYENGDDSSDEEEESNQRNTVSNGINHHPSTPKPSAGPKSFVPRAVMMNVLKRSQDLKSGTPTVATLHDLEAMRPSSAASNTSDGSVAKSSHSGVWTVTDADRHTPSIASDASNNSTSGTWKVTDVSKVIEVAPSRQSPTPPRSSTCTTSTSFTSSFTSTPEKRVVKRGSSIEEYEAELDRGKTKKPKFKRSFH